MAQNRFRPGRSVFRCAICGRSCREAGQSTDSECCAECYELAGIQNGLWDGVYGPGEMRAERDRYFKRCVARGGDADRIKAQFGDLWKTGE